MFNLPGNGRKTNLLLEILMIVIIPWYPWLLTWFPQTRGLHDDPRVLALAEELGL